MVGGDGEVGTGNHPFKHFFQGLKALLPTFVGEVEEGEDLPEIAGEKDVFFVMAVVTSEDIGKACFAIFEVEAPEDEEK